MIRFLADEDFSNVLVRAFRRRRPAVDLVRVQEVGLSGRPDPAVLAWAATEGRVLLTHDVRTMIAQANARLLAGEPLPGVLVVAQSADRSRVLDSLALIDAASESEEWAGQVVFLPLR